MVFVNVLTKDLKRLYPKTATCIRAPQSFYEKKKSIS